MSGIASKSQLRMSFLRYALFTVPALLLLGALSASLSGADASNLWFAALRKPPVMPGAWAFGAIWSFLYVLLGLSLAMVLHARGAKSRRRALGLFAVELALALAWAPLFFAFHKLALALSVLAAMFVLCIALILVIWRIRVLAGLLLYPWLAWLMFAGLLNYQLMIRNPNAETLAPAGARTDIPL